jgi:hypothetical protein
MKITTVRVTLPEDFAPALAAFQTVFPSVGGVSYEEFRNLGPTLLAATLAERCEEQHVGWVEDYFSTRERSWRGLVSWTQQRRFVLLAPEPGFAPPHGEEVRIEFPGSGRRRRRSLRVWATPGWSSMGTRN